MLTANVKALSPKIEELITLIKVENFDVIALNEKCLHKKNTSICLQKLPYIVTKVFMWTNQLQQEGGGGGIIMYVKNTLNPIERKSSATCTGENIQVDINPKTAVHLKHVLIYVLKYTNHSSWWWWVLYNAGRNFVITTWICYHEWLYSSKHRLDTTSKSTSAPGNKLMQLFADNNVSQYVRDTTRQNNIVDLHWEK